MVKINAKKVELSTENRLDLESETKLVSTSSSYVTLLRIIADIMDSSALGFDTWCAIGSTENKSALTFTLVVEGSRETFYITSLKELCEALRASL